MAATVPRRHRFAVHWFRKGLRLHDNPALVDAVERAEGAVFPLFIIDPWFANEETVGVLRYQFLLESLRDLDASLRARQSRLFVARGKPEEVLPRLFDEWGATLLTFETDTEPYALTRDAAILDMFASDPSREVSTQTSHTLFDPARLLRLNKNKVTSTYNSFCKLVSTLSVPIPVDPPQTLRTPPGMDTAGFDVPTLAEMGYKPPSTPSLYLGGETEGLARMRRHLKDKRYICEFEKPKTSPNALTPSTTVLSPHLKFGCVSSRRLYHEILGVYSEVRKGGGKHTQPPTSLIGQMLWREFYYFNAYGVGPVYGQMVGNPICTQVDWLTNPEHLRRWEYGETGYPYIDAIMNQLRTEGWIHHLARHSVACFLTRGDLFLSWEEGARIFDKYLLDADWALNNGNWMWLSASSFFYQFFRVYGPVSFGKKTDKEGHYIKKYVPVLARMPAKYIYEPWLAPKHVQKEAGCIVGKDYPEPMVEHGDVSKRNIQWMSAAYKRKKEGSGAGKQEKAPTTKRKSTSSMKDHFAPTAKKRA